MGLVCTGGWDCGVNINNMDKVLSCDYLRGDLVGAGGSRALEGNSKVEGHLGKWMEKLFG